MKTLRRLHTLFQTLLFILLPRDSPFRSRSGPPARLCPCNASRPDFRTGSSRQRHSACRLHCEASFHNTDLYRNKTLIEHAKLKAAAKQLRDLKLGIEQASSGVDQPTNGDERQGPTISLSNLREAYSSCVACANDVVEAVEKLTVSGENQKWKSFRHALSTVFKKDRLDAISQRLADARQQLILFLLLHTE